MMSLFSIGAALGATGVFCGALGSHWIKQKFNDANTSQSWAIAAHYQILHAIPIMFLHSYPELRTIGGGLLTAGIALFSGSIYGLVLIPKWKKILGPTTPIGGLLLIAGWSYLAYKGINY